MYKDATRIEYNYCFCLDQSDNSILKLGLKGLLE